MKSLEGYWFLFSLDILPRGLAPRIVSRPQHRRSLTLKPGVTHRASGPWASGIASNPVAAPHVWGPSCWSCFRTLRLQKSVLWNQECGLCFSRALMECPSPRSFPHSLSFLIWYYFTVRPFPITLYKITSSPRIHSIPLLHFCLKPFCTIWHFKHSLVGFCFFAIITPLQYKFQEGI